MKTAEQNEVWRPTPKQAEFIAACEREVLMGGGSGSGKSSALLLAAAHGINNPAHRALIVRKSFARLRDMIGRSLEIFPAIGGVYNAATTTWNFRGAKIEFGYCDSPLDHGRYLGREWNFIGVDELCEFAADTEDANGERCSSTYLFLISRLRTTKGSGLPLEIRATCVPSGVGKLWVQRRFHIPDDGADSLCVDETTGLHRRFIRATLENNPHLLGSAYERTLQGLPQHQRRAWLEGCWDSVEGSAVFSEWNRDLHTVAPFEIPRGWRVWRACDDGYAAPLACLWLCHDEDTSDTIFCVRELYARGLTPEAAATAILAIDAQVANGEELRGVIDSAAFANIGLGSSRGHAMNSLGCNWRPVEKGRGSVLAGLSAIHARLAQRADGSVGLKLFREHCPNLVRELTAAVYSPNNPEEIDASCPVHSVDALRYGLSNRPPRAWRARVVF